jgi:hypothetical protein
LVVSAVFIEIFQHNQQYDTLLSIIPCTHKLKAGIAYYVWKIYLRNNGDLRAQAM